MNIGGNVSNEDMQRVDDMMNHGEFESGFDNEGAADAGSGFDDLNSLFSDDSSSGGFGGNGASQGGFTQQGGGFSQQGGGFTQQGNGFGQQSGFGGGGFSGNGFGQQGGGFGQQGGFGAYGYGAGSPFGMQQPMQQQQQADTMDKLMEGGVAAVESLGHVVVELFKSIKTRSADDFGYLSRNLIITSAVMLPASILIGIIGGASGIHFLSFSGMASNTLITSILALGVGTAGIGTAALVLSKSGEMEMSDPNSLGDVPAGEDNVTQDYEDHIGDELDDLFGDDFDDLEDLSDDIAAEMPDPVFAPADGPEAVPEEINFKDEIKNVRANQVISRQILFETFKPMFAQNTPGFSSKTEIDKNSMEFKSLQTYCIKALANLANCQLEEVNSQLVSASSTLFSYELRLKRINKVKRTDELAREIEVYVRDNSEEDSVNAAVYIEGDVYKIIITKGTEAVVTFGDVFTQDYCCKYFKDDKHKLPIITGIDELGKVWLDDAKQFDSMLIAGKPRSGKSWYVISILMSMMLFNSPDRVQFIIVDPKKTNLFKTMALMPHVAGIHDDEHILEILEDIIEIEAPRRKQLLVDNRCDDIWALWDAGVPLPVLYLVIDEYITVINNLNKDDKKKFDGYILVLLSQLPSLGIRLIFVPHRATGIVDKTNRTLLNFTAAIRADNEDVLDTLGVKKFDRALTKPGDTAVKSASMKTATYVRGAALTTSDSKNTKFIEFAASAFYKMGVDIPKLSDMRVAVNRDEDAIREELTNRNGHRVQFNADDVEAMADSIDLSTIEQ